MEVSNLQILSPQKSKKQDVNQIRAQFPNLQQLVIDDFNGRNLTNEGFSKLKLLKSLRNLSLANVAIDDLVLDYIAELPQLNSLHIKQTLISEEGVANLQRRLPTTKIVYSERVLSPGLWP